MDVIRGIANIKPHHKNQALTIGNFDGVHRGHQFVITKLQELAALHGCKTIVMTFEPHPALFFASQAAAANPKANTKTTPKARITPLRQKLQALAKLGVDAVIVLPFNEKLASLTGREFVERILYQQLQVAHLLLGHDFRFGARRTGDFKLLQAMSEELGFNVMQAPAFNVAEQRLSSTVLRQSLQKGDIERVNHLLARTYKVRAKVVHGDGRGRTWGFPTANLPMTSSQCPLPYGIYVVRAISSRYGTLEAVASFGVRPTVAEGLRSLLEVHVLEGTYDFYHDWLEVEFLHRLRDELVFADFAALKVAIAKDCLAAKAFFENNNHD